MMVAAGEPISALGICALLLERRGAPHAWAPRAQVLLCAANSWWTMEGQLVPWYQNEPNE